VGIDEGTSVGNEVGSWVGSGVHWWVAAQQRTKVGVDQSWQEVWFGYREEFHPRDEPNAAK
jgi:hypothetical protein